MKRLYVLEITPFATMTVCNMKEAIIQILFHGAKLREIKHISQENFERWYK